MWLTSFEEKRINVATIDKGNICVINIHKGSFVLLKSAQGSSVHIQQGCMNFGCWHAVCELIRFGHLSLQAV